MAAPTYTAHALVLKKTKLGESDLILTLLADDGSQLRVVAKGARKPQSSFASRLELFCEVETLCAKGRSLDIVKEARLVNGHESLRFDMTKATAAGPMAELLAKLSQPELENRVLFDASCVAFDALDAADAVHAPALCAAHLLKTLAYGGLRPSFSQCVGCGAPAACSAISAAPGAVWFSYAEGGILCEECHRQADALRIPAYQPQWGRELLHARFSQVPNLQIPQGAALGVLQMTRELINAHVGTRLKSLEFLLTQSYLFSEE